MQSSQVPLNHVPYQCSSQKTTPARNLFPQFVDSDFSYSSVGKGNKNDREDINFVDNKD